MGASLAAFALLGLVAARCIVRFRRGAPSDPDAPERGFEPVAARIGRLFATGAVSTALVGTAAIAAFADTIWTDTIAVVAVVELSAIGALLGLANDFGFFHVARSRLRSGVFSSALFVASGAALAFGIGIFVLGGSGMPRGYFDHLDRFDRDYELAAFAATIAVGAMIVLVVEAFRFPWDSEVASRAQVVVDPSVFA